MVVGTGIVVIADNGCAILAVLTFADLCSVAWIVVVAIGVSTTFTQTIIGVCALARGGGTLVGGARVVVITDNGRAVLAVIFLAGFRAVAGIVVVAVRIRFAFTCSIVCISALAIRRIAFVGRARVVVVTDHLLSLDTLVVRAGFRAGAGIIVVTVRVDLTLTQTIVGVAAFAGGWITGVVGARIEVVAVHPVSSNALVGNALFHAIAAIVIVALNVRLTFTFVILGVHALTVGWIAAVGCAHVVVITRHSSTGLACVVDACFCAVAGIIVVAVGVTRALACAVTAVATLTCHRVTGVGGAEIFIVTIYRLAGLAGVVLTALEPITCVVIIAITVGFTFALAADFVDALTGRRVTGVSGTFIVVIAVNYGARNTLIVLAGLQSVTCVLVVAFGIQITFTCVDARVRALAIGGIAAIRCAGIVVVTDHGCACLAYIANACFHSVAGVVV